MQTKHIRHGLGAVRPYVYGKLDLPEMIEYAFGGVEVERQQMGPESFHIEMRITDSVIALETGSPLPPDYTVASIYVYVPDVDAAYERALEKGATPIAPPEEKPYNERAAGIRDSLGNVWWIATFRSPEQ